jgi:FkbM family methyltransferase
MNRRAFLGGISRTLVVGTVGGIVIGAVGAIGASAILHDARLKFGKISFAEQGEDLIVESIFARLKIPLRTYLDIGAYDPMVASNTYLFYGKGCRGVLVEPNPAMCGMLKRFRPRDTVLGVGIGATEQAAADYYILSDANGDLSPLNTFSKEEADRVVALGGGRKISRVVKIPLLNINRVMQQQFHGAPDFVSIDTEGLDLEILRSLDFDRFRPAVVCAEAGPSPDGLKIIELMGSKGYSIRGYTSVNTIFVDERLRKASARVP